jgi:hypothetical protein
MASAKVGRDDPTRVSFTPNSSPWKCPPPFGKYHPESGSHPQHTTRPYNPPARLHGARKGSQRWGEQTLTKGGCSSIRFALRLAPPLPPQKGTPEAKPHISKETGVGGCAQPRGHLCLLSSSSGGGGPEKGVGAGKCVTIFWVVEQKCVGTNLGWKQPLDCCVCVGVPAGRCYEGGHQAVSTTAGPRGLREERGGALTEPHKRAPFTTN